MKNEPKALKEIHVIREAIYEETKNMTPEEQAKYAHRGDQKLIKQYDLKVKRVIYQPFQFLYQTTSLCVPFYRRL